MSEEHFQVILKINDSYGVHLIYKDKRDNSYTIEGHEEDLPKKTLLKQTPKYSFPLNEEQVIEEFAKQGLEFRKAGG